MIFNQCGVKMKRTIIFMLLIAAVFMATNLNAQRRRMDPKERIKQLKADLNLTDEQTVKIEAIFKEQMDEFMKLRDSFSGDRSGIREKFMSIRDKYNKKINSVLTEEQQKKYKKMQDEQRKRMQQRMGGRGF